jgi:hypothetical protein
MHSPNEPIAHDDPNALCTKLGRERFQALRARLLIFGPNGGIIGVSASAPQELLEACGPYQYEDHRKSGRFP